jgi:RNA polymerase sigma-70 factor (ECF subfamily)
MIGISVVEGAANGADLISALAERHYISILNYLYQLVRDRRLAEDLAQDTFLRAFDKRDQLPEIGNQRAWLYRVATNLAINAVKRRSRFVWLPWAILDSLHSREANPEEQSSQRSSVENALAALSLPYRIPLLLRDQFGFSIGEIASALGITEDNVSVRLHRARQMFAEAYKQEERE